MLKHSLTGSNILMELQVGLVMVAQMAKTAIDDSLPSSSDVIAVFADLCSLVLYKIFIYFRSLIVQGQACLSTDQQGNPTLSS